MDTLIKLINEKLAKLNQEKNSLTNQVDETLVQSENLIQSVINNPANINTLPIDQINELFELFSEEEIAKIMMYRLVLQNGLISNSEEDTREIIDLFSRANLKLQDIKKSMQVNEELEEQINKYKIAKQKIEQVEKNKIVSPEDIDLICDLLVEFGMDPIKASEYVIAITKSSINSIINSNQSEEAIEDAEETNLNRKDVEKLFKTYNYDFNDFSQENQEMILKYGNLNTMDGIFRAFVTIGKSIEIKNNRYLSLENSFARILTFSNKDIVLEVLSKVKADYENNNEINSTTTLDYFYSQMLTKFEVFIKGNKKAKIRKKYDIDRGPGGDPPPPPPDPPEDEVIYGRKDDFNAICSELDKLGIKLTYVIDKVPTLLTFTHSLFKRNLDELNLYGITRDKFVKALSHIVSSPDISGSIDAHIESGLFEYLLDNMSSITRLPYDYTFYRAKRAKQLNTEGRIAESVPLFSDYFKNRLCLHPNITTRKQVVMDIKPKNKRESNGAEIVGQYNDENDFPQFAEVDVKNARGPIVFAENHPLITELDVFRPVEFGDNTKQSNIYYDINGIKISRIKVLRIFEELIKMGLDNEPNSVLFALTRNSILTHDEFTMLSRTLNNLYSKGVGSV